MLNIKKYINKHEVQFCVENIDSSLFVKLNGRYKAVSYTHLRAHET